MRQEDKKIIAKAQSHIPMIRQAIKDLSQVMTIDDPVIPEKAVRALGWAGSYLTNLISLTKEREKAPF